MSVKFKLKSLYSRRSLIGAPVIQNNELGASDSSSLERYDYSKSFLL